MYSVVLDSRERWSSIQHTEVIRQMTSEDGHERNCFSNQEQLASREHHMYFGQLKDRNSGHQTVDFPAGGRYGIFLPNLNRQLIRTNRQTSLASWPPVAASPRVFVI